jgi:hypothetical protein
VRWARPAAVCAAIAVALGFYARPITNSDDAATRVVAIRAGGGVVPSNLLRVYIELSAPMEPGAAYEHIHLLDARGNEVENVFLVLREELWSPDYRRLTLLFDPGRVKRGIRSNVEMGAPLTSGRQYQLVVDSLWRDAENRPLGAPYFLQLRVAGFDSIGPEPQRWSMSLPRVGTRDSLRVNFGDALDHALAMRLITVLDSTNTKVDGRVSMRADDRVWLFVPSTVWRAGARLRVDPALEDLAGNNVTRPFDTDRLRASSPAGVALTSTTPRIMPLVMR